MGEAITEAVRMISLVFYELWISPETPIEFRALMWLPVVGAIASTIIRIIRRRRYRS